MTVAGHIAHGPAGQTVPALTLADAARIMREATKTPARQVESGDTKRPGDAPTSRAMAPGGEVLMQRQNTLPERLRTKITQRPDGCWEWIGRRDQLGYGRIGWEGRNALAHRVVYVALVGPIPGWATLDHLCRNRWCVRPAHLEPVTLRENILRGDGVGVRNAAKTHCKNGHEFTPENTYIKQGKRACRECGRQANRRHRARKAVA